MPLRVDLAGQPVPGPAHAGDVVHAAAVAQDQLVPQRVARSHAVVPRHVVEPEQEFLRHRRQVAELRRHRRRVLRHRIAAAGTAVEANALRIGAVVVDRGPVRARAAFDPRRRPVVVAAAHQVVQAQRGHVVDHRLARAHHHRHHRIDEARVGGEGHLHPLARDRLRVQVRVPGQAAEREPVGLVEVRAAPVAVAADVGHAGHAGELVSFERTVDDPGHGRARPARMGVGTQRLRVHRRQVGQVGGEAQVLLGDLELHHQRRLGHRPEQRMERLARLEVDRPVFDLHQHVRREPAVVRHELGVGLFGAVVGFFVRVDEGAPHHDAAMRRQRLGQHVGAVGVRAAVVLRPGLAFGIGLDQEAAESGNDAVHLVGLGLPPRPHRRVERIGGLEPADLDRRAEARAQVDLDPVRPEHPGQRRRLLQVHRRERLRAGVDVVEHRAVDADRGIGAGVVGIARAGPVRQLVPVPDRLAGVAALDVAVQVVPVVEYPHAGLRCLADVERVQRLRGLDQAQQVEGAVQRAELGVGRDHGRRTAVDAHAAQQVALLAQRRQVQPQCRQLRRSRRRAHHDRACAPGAGRRHRRPAQQAVQATLQFVADRAAGRGAGIDDQFGRMGAIGGLAAGVERNVAQPERVAVLGHRRQARHQPGQPAQAEQPGAAPAAAGPGRIARPMG